MSALQVRMGAAHNEDTAPVSEVLEDGLASEREIEMSLTGKLTNRRSDAKNAYDLMTDIRDYILEEPKRIWMKDWVIQGAEIKDTLGTKGPACGTVGCIAGNVRVLTGNLSGHGATSLTAMEILGSDNWNLRDDLYNLFHETQVDAKYGTKKYARIVAGRIEEFQFEHEADLRAVKVRPNQ